jgi:hypothetical protein
LYLLRCLQSGLSIADLDLIEVGDAFDIMTEASNDSHKYSQIATQEDFDRF